MNRDKLKAVLKHYEDYNSKYDGKPLDIDKLADYLIANGIGDITAEKHRADVAEEALRNGAVGEDLYCSSDYEREQLYLHLLKEAEERLRRNNGEQQ